MSQNEYALKEYPILRVVIGFGLIAGGFYFFFKANQWLIASIALILGLLAILFASVLEIKGNAITRSLIFSRRGLIKNEYRELSFSEILGVGLGGNGGTHRIEIRLTDGDVLPFTSYYSSGRRGKEKKAKKLRDFIGVDNASARTGASAQLRAEQELITGNQDEIHEQDGVRWQLKTIVQGNSPITRWHALDYSLPNNFLYLVQKGKEQGQLPAKGLLNPIYEKLFATSMKLIGFAEEDMPNTKNADMLSLDAPLDKLFSAYGSDPQGVARILNSYARIALIRWAEAHPCPEGAIGELAILFNPNGLFLAMPGYVQKDHLTDVTDLGIELVLAQ